MAGSRGGDMTLQQGYTEYNLMSSSLGEGALEREKERSLKKEMLEG